MGIYCFQNCSSLKAITLPETLDKLMMRVFYNCKALTEITIPSSITSISNRAIYGCSALTAIHMLSTTPPTLTSGALDMTNNCPIYVPKSAYDTYIAANVWVNYKARIVGETTGISGIKLDKDEEDDIYDLQGRHLNVQDMRNGQIYIVGGRKVLFK